MLSKDLRAPIEVIFISIYKNIVALSSHGAVEDTTLHSRTEGAQAVVLHLGGSQLDDGARLVVVRNTDLVAISTQRTKGIGKEKERVPGIESIGLGIDGHTGQIKLVGGTLLEL